MEVLKEVLKSFLQEILLVGDKLFHETDDGNKRNVNHDFKYSNLGLKTNYIPKIDMRKFDGKDPGTWIL